VSEIASYLGQHAVALDTLDPGAPFDDLEPLAERLRAARVVAVGESAHFVGEYALLRHRLLQFMVERCGFTVFALESGFSEGRAVDAWVHGGPGELEAVSRDGITYGMGRGAELRDQLRWMRTAGVPFVGLDVPGSTASPLLALANVRQHLDPHDPVAVAMVDRLIERTRTYADQHQLTAIGNYAALGRPDRDALTAGLAELTVRMDALPTGDPDDHDTARHELRLVCLLDQSLRGHATRLLDGDTAHAAVSPRDLGMAETVFRTLDRGGPDTKIVIGAANGHIQRTPFALPGGALPVAGSHLATWLGEAYVAIAGTAVAGTTTTRRADAAAAGGVAVVDVELDEPVDGSVEALLPGPAVVDLRGARGRMPGPDRIRVMDTYQPTPVLDAFDLVAVLPRISPADRV
jgi:erythromycin esterase